MATLLKSIVIVAAIMLLGASAHAFFANHGMMVSGPAGPLPTAVSPSNGSVSDTATSGTVITPLGCTMSDGSNCSATFSVTDPNNLVSVNGTNLVVTTTLTAAKDGVYSNITLKAFKNGRVASQPYTLTVNSTGGGGTPAPAVAAGFNQQIVNYDFVNNTANGASLDWTQKNLWLNEGGASNPLFWKGWSGFGGSQLYPDSNVLAGTDPTFGNRALILTWNQNQLIDDPNNRGHCLDSSHCVIGTFLQTAPIDNTTTKGGLGFTFYYAEVVFRIASFNNAFYNLWGLCGSQPPCQMEHDGLETSGSVGHSTTAMFNHQFGWVPTIHFDHDWSQYSTMAWRFVSTGNYQPDQTGNDQSNSWMCSYVGGDGQAITSAQSLGCNTNVSNQSMIVSGDSTKMNFQFFLETNDATQAGNNIMYVKSLKIYACNAWTPSNQLAACYSTISNPSP